MGGKRIISVLFVFYAIFSVNEAFCALDSRANPPAAKASSTENQKLLDDKQALEKKVADISAKFQEAENAIEGLKSNIYLLEQENSRLKESNSSLAARLDQLILEKADLETRFNSLKELKKAIRKVKLDIHGKKVERHKEKVKKQKEIDKQRLVEGNRGFLVKDGKNISGTKVNIEIVPE